MPEAGPPGTTVLFLREAQIRQAQDLFFLAWRDFAATADAVLEQHGLGRAHHRALHFIARDPGLSVGDLLTILGVTKQSLARVLAPLVAQDLVHQSVGRSDRRQRRLTLTEAGAALERSLFDRQRERLLAAYREAGGTAVDGFRRVMRGVMEPAGRLMLDDDSRLRSLLSRYLSENGFRVSVAAHAAEARDKLRFLQPDALVLDVMMPGESGLALTSALRAENGAVPILLLTARGAPEDRIAGFESGADDYLGKPFEPRELVLRLRAMLRRAPQAAISETPPGPMRLGKLEFDTERAELRGPAGVVHLTGSEAALLSALAAKPGQVFSREDIAAALEMDDAGERAIDVQVTRLRRKIEADPREPRFLHTVRGRGYVLKPGI